MGVSGGGGVGKWEGWIVYNMIHALKEFTGEYRKTDPSY